MSPRNPRGQPDAGLAEDELELELELDELEIAELGFVLDELDIGVGLGFNVVVPDGFLFLSIQSTNELILVKILNIIFQMVLEKI